MPKVNPEFRPILAGFTVAILISVFTTVVRLIHRLRRRQLWWDDLWALISLLGTVYLGISAYLNGVFVDRTTWSEKTQSFFIYCAFVTQATAVWAGRMSIQATMVYILPPGRNRTISKFSMWAMGFFMIATIICSIFWNGYPLPAIPSPPWLLAPTIVNLVLNVIGTVWLVAWPIYLLNMMGLRKSHRRLLIVAFSSSVLLLAIDIWHAVNIVNAQLLAMISSALELALACIVANALVLTSYLYRTIRGPAGMTRDTPRPDSETGEKTIDAHNATDASRSQNRTMSSGALSSSVGPLTTVYTSSEDASGHYMSTINPPSSTREGLHL